MRDVKMHIWNFTPPVVLLHGAPAVVKVIIVSDRKPDEVWRDFRDGDPEMAPDLGPRSYTVPCMKATKAEPESVHIYPERAEQA